MRKEKETRKETTMKENMGKLILDVGKLAVGGIIIGGILRSAIPHVILITGGTIAVAILFILGLLLTVKEKKE
jgi:uncharacterized membrane protein YraQ (UPF0718 family)